MRKWAHLARFGYRKTKARAASAQRLMSLVSPLLSFSMFMRFLVFQVGGVLFNIPATSSSLSRTMFFRGFTSSSRSMKCIKAKVQQDQLVSCFKSVRSASRQDETFNRHLCSRSGIVRDISAARKSQRCCASCQILLRSSRIRRLQVHVSIVRRIIKSRLVHCAKKNLCWM
jgi:transposase-like protein